MLRRSFALSGGPSEDMAGMHFKDKFGDMLALQRQSISLSKKQLAGSNITIDDCGDSWLPGSAPQPADQEGDLAVQLGGRVSRGGGSFNIGVGKNKMTGNACLLPAMNGRGHNT